MNLRRYEELAKRIVGILKEVAVADAMVAQANATLPAGKPPISFVEHEARGWAREEDRVRVLSEESVWQYDDGGRVADEHLDLIKSADGRNGVLERNIGLRGGVRTFNCRKVGLRTKKIVPGRAEIRPEYLAASVTLPGLIIGAPDIWAPTGPVSFDDPNGAKVLDAIAAAEADWSSPPADPRFDNPPQIHREFFDLGEKEAAE